MPILTNRMRLWFNFYTLYADKYGIIFLQEGYSPLYLASSNGHTDVVETLLDHGADPNQTGKVIDYFSEAANLLKISD